MHTLGSRDEVLHGCGHREGRLNQARVLIDADMDFRLVGSLVALLGLRHPGIPFPVVVMGGTGRFDQRLLRGGINE